MMLTLAFVGTAHADDSCALRVAPADAGAYVMPGGFLLIHPRNAAVADDYSGCKQVWIMRSPGDTPLLMRLRFERGVRVMAQVFDGRGGAAPRASCAAKDAGAECTGLADNPIAQLHVPTWPRVCAEDAERPECAQAPQ
jgi:hypothetical protein